MCSTACPKQAQAACVQGRACPLRDTDPSRETLEDLAFYVWVGVVGMVAGLVAAVW